MRPTLLIALNLALAGCSAKDATPAAEGNSACVVYKEAGAMLYVGPLGPMTPTLALPPSGDDMRMDVLHSSATMLELAFADVGVQIGASEPVSLPVLERGRIVRLSLRQWGRYPNYEWFVAVHDDASRELLFALHKANLGLFEGSVFGESNALGFELSVSDVCETFEPKHECTSKGARLTQLAVDVNASESAVPVRISSGETSTISLNGRDTRIWVGRALRIRIEDYFGCADSIPEDDLHFAVW